MNFPELADCRQIAAACSFWNSDRYFTAPVHGFIDHHDYWHRASKPLLKSIAVPTLVLNARNDPFMPESALPGRDEAAPCVELDFPAPRWPASALPRAAFPVVSIGCRTA